MKSKGDTDFLRHSEVQLLLGGYKTYSLSFSLLSPFPSSHSFFPSGISNFFIFPTLFPSFLIPLLNMWPIGLAAAITACLVPMAHAAFPSTPEDAQAAMQSFLDRNPISTVSAPESQATATDLDSLKNAVLAGNFTASRSWDFLRNPCPGSCKSLGISSSTWPVYPSMDRLAKCDETLLLNFALYTEIDGTNGKVKIRGCVADLDTDSTTSSGGDNSSCVVPNNSKSVTTSLQLGWDNGAATGSASEAVAALEQLLAYESLDQSPCNETINFASSGKTSVGIYMGSALHRQGLLPSILKDIIARVQDDGITETTVVQLCDSRTSRYSLGVIINSNDDLLATQKAVQSWRNSTCHTTLDNVVSGWKKLTYSVPVASNSSNSTSHWARRDNGAKILPRDGTCTAIQVVANDTCTTLPAECGITTTQFNTYNPDLCSSPLPIGTWVCCTSGSVPNFAPSPDADDNCYAYTIKKDDTCSALAAAYTITVDDINSWNNNTWGWMGCGDLLADETICLSSGWPPMPATISNAVCGPQVNDTATAPHGADLSILNECPLNACCDIWGQCGITTEFCTETTSTTGAPGTAANNTNGCISNCGTQIYVGPEPSEYFAIGYFEGYDILQRTCLTPLITDIDTTNYTHIHMSFATLNPDYSFNVSTIEDQLGAFQNLVGVKRVISVGGWDFSTDSDVYNIFREAVSTSANRATLVANTIDFLNTYDLDGIDWDWEYPGAPDIPGIPADSTTSGENLFLFLMELKQQMPSGKTISTTAASSYWYLRAYPIKAISQVVDYIVIMTYDLHGQWDWNNTFADPGCPLGGCLRSHVNLTETLSAMSMITKAGVPSSMVALGVASYARSFQMSQAGCYGPDCPFTGPDSGATPGKCTNTAGYISNWELYGIADQTSVHTYVDALSNSNIMVWDDTQWAAFMDDSIAESRRQLYESMNFLGTAEWAVDLDEANSTTSDSVEECQMYIDPTVWLEDTPIVTAEPGCMLIWPPMPLPTNTTIVFPLWPTNVTYYSTATSTMSYGSSFYTYLSVGSAIAPTQIPIDPRKRASSPRSFDCLN